MKSGILKNILLTNDVKKIVVKSDFYSTPLEVVCLQFDKLTRNRMYLEVDVKQNSKAQRCGTIKSYINDFKDSHTICIFQYYHIPGLR